MAAPIRAFVGPNGSGKTLAAVVCGVSPALAVGRSVVSTCEIYHPAARLLESWRELPGLRDCVLLLDEVTSCLPSRSSMSMPSHLQRMLNQLRKVDVEVLWTAPNWARADVILREVTQEVTECRGYLPDRFERRPGIAPWWRSVEKARRDGKAKMLRDSRWPSMRLFRWTSYDANLFDEFTHHAVKDVKPKSRHWYYRPWHDHDELYGTMDPVQLLDHVDDIGQCVVCGGQRKRQACTCERGRPAAIASPTGAAIDAGPFLAGTGLGPVGAGRPGGPRSTAR